MRKKGVKEYALRRQRMRWKKYLFVAQERWPHGAGSASDLAFRIGHVSFIKKGHVFMAGVERGLTAGTHTHTHTS